MLKVYFPYIVFSVRVFSAERDKEGSLFWIEGPYPKSTKHQINVTNKIY